MDIYSVALTFIVSYDFWHDFAGKGVLDVLGGVQQKWFLSVFSERDTYVHVRYMLSPFRRSVVCLSVCLSDCNVGALYSAGWNFRQFFSPYDSPGALVFWCQ